MTDTPRPHRRRIDGPGCVCGWTGETGTPDYRATTAHIAQANRREGLEALKPTVATPATPTYAALRRLGNLELEDGTVIPTVRAMARRDGLKIVQATERDYMGRARYHLSLVDPKNPTLVVRPDAG